MSYSQQSAEMNKLALQAYARGDVLRADSLMTLSIKYDDQHYDYLKFYNRGIFRKEMDSISSAVTDLKRSIELKANFYPAYENLSICLYYQDLNDEALKTILKGLEVDKSQIEGYVLAIMFIDQKKKPNQVIEICNKGLKIKRDQRLYAYRSVANSYVNNFEKSSIDIKEIELYFGTSNVYYWDALIFLQYKTKSKDFCKTVNGYTKIHEKEISPIFQDNDCIKEIKKCR